MAALCVWPPPLAVFLEGKIYDVFMRAAPRPPLARDRSYVASIPARAGAAESMGSVAPAAVRSLTICWYALKP